MLSRLSFRNVSSQVKALASCGIQTSAVTCNAPRPKRPVEAPPVRMGFIPEEWFQFFYPKTGVSGPYVFMGTLSTYLLSKEWYVIEHEFYNGLSILFCAVYVTVKAGDQIGKYLDKQVDDFEESFNVQKQESITELKDTIAEIEKEKWRSEGQLMIFDIRKQNVLMQLEADYRQRLANVYSEVKKRLDYHAQIDLIERRMSQKHMVQWITSNVLKSITPEQEKATLMQCIKDLEGLSAKSAA